MTTPPALRASDEDRERVVQMLRAHFAAGRLDADELEQRCDAAYSARTHGELAALTEDLPQLPDPPDAVAQSGGSAALSASGRHELELRAQRDRLARGELQRAGRGATIVVGCVAVWAVSGGLADGEFFWPVFVALFVLVRLGARLWRLYGPAPDVALFEHELLRAQQREQALADREQQLAARQRRMLAREQRRALRDELRGELLDQLRQRRAGRSEPRKHDDRGGSQGL